MAENSVPSRADATLRVLASLVGTLPPSVLAAACLARFLPFAEEARVTVGHTLAVPLWVSAIAVVFLAQSAQRAWLACLVASLAFGALVYAVPL